MNNILNFGLRNCKKFYLTKQKLIGQEKKRRNTLVVFFLNIYILLVIFREQGHNMCQNGISYDFSILVNTKYFRNKCQNGISYDILSKIGLLRNAVLALFTTPGTIELKRSWQLSSESKIKWEILEFSWVHVNRYGNL